MEQQNLEAWGVRVKMVTIRGGLSPGKIWGKDPVGGGRRTTGGPGEGLARGRAYHKPEKN